MENNAADLENKALEMDALARAHSRLGREWTADLFRAVAANLRARKAAL